MNAMDGQGWVQVGQLGLAFLLSALIGLERQVRGKSAGLRTQTIVGTTAALILLVSKFGFADVVSEGTVMLDPSRVAAQIVTGIGFLGAGLILTRHGAVHGLTTAASVWETAAIGMAAGSGLWVLALTVTGLHFVAIFGLSALAARIPATSGTSTEVDITYLDGHGVLRDIIQTIVEKSWNVHGLLQSSTSDGSHTDSQDSLVNVTLELRGSSDINGVVAAVSGLDGVRSVRILSEEDLD
ncbi:MAG: MgtC/SapB family protein [Microthrixaceae bacterium]